MSRVIYSSEYKTPTPRREPLLSLAEMVRRIEWFRAGTSVTWPDPIPLPIGRVCEPGFLKRRAG